MITLNFIRKLISGATSKFLIVSLLVILCQPVTARAEENSTEEIAVPVKVTDADGQIAESATAEASTTEVIAEPIETTLVAEEGATLLGEFRLTYYCCERYKHICGDGTGLTASGRPVEAGHSIAVDPNIIPLGSRVWIDFGDGEGWHEYSADDTGSLVEGNHIDIAIGTHKEALRQLNVVGRVCFSPPPSENCPAG